MKHYRLKDMVNGWFVGGFIPSVFSTDACEVAVKQYKSGDIEAAHFHRIATEITVVVSGKIRMAGREFENGDIVVLEPGEASSFEAISDAINVVVKLPGALNDKFFVR
jgi:hypothetical protein